MGKGGEYQRPSLLWRPNLIDSVAVRKRIQLPSREKRLLIGILLEQQRVKTSALNPPWTYMSPL